MQLSLLPQLWTLNTSTIMRRRTCSVFWHLKWSKRLAALQGALLNKRLNELHSCRKSPNTERRSPKCWRSWRLSDPEHSLSSTPSVGFFQSESTGGGLPFLSLLRSPAQSCSWSLLDLLQVIFLPLVSLGSPITDQSPKHFFLSFERK